MMGLILVNDDNIDKFTKFLFLQNYQLYSILAHSDLIKIFK